MSELQTVAVAEGVGGENRALLRGARLSILMPAYNERETIAEALARVKAAGAELGADLEILVVDDASTDGTREILEADPAIRLIRQPKNGGKGTALRAAIPHVSGAVVIVQDADLEYDPRDYG